MGWRNCLGTITTSSQANHNLISVSSSEYGTALRFFFSHHLSPLIFSERAPVPTPRRMNVKRLLQILALLAVLTSILSAPTRLWGSGPQPWPKTPCLPGTACN
jgi:hypothetical protein